MALQERQKDDVARFLSDAMSHAGDGPHTPASLLDALAAASKQAAATDVLYKVCDGWLRRQHIYQKQPFLLSLSCDLNTRRKGQRQRRCRSDATLHSLPTDHLFRLFALLHPNLSNRPYRYVLDAGRAINTASARHRLRSASQQSSQAALIRLGLDHTFFVTGGCEFHYGDKIPATTAATAYACRFPTTRTVPCRAEARTLQAELDAQSTLWEQGLQGSRPIEGPCPLCPAGGNRVTCASSPCAGAPNYFFVAFEDPLSNEDKRAKPPTISASVAAYNDTYRTVAVVYRDLAVTELSYFCHAFYPDCWHVFDSRVPVFWAEHAHTYDDAAFQTPTISPVLVCLVRESENQDADLDVQRRRARQAFEKASSEVRW